MMESMTGFASHEIDKKTHHTFFQVKSVNSRYLDIKTHLSPNLYSIETDLRALVQKEFLRGSVDLNIYCMEKKMESLVGPLENWVSDYKKLSKKLDLKENLSLDMVVKKASSLGFNKLKDAEKKEILKGFKQALKALKKQRVKEGQGLLSVFEEEMEKAKRILEEVRTGVSHSKRDIHKKWQEKLSKLEMEVEPERLAQEVAVLVEKSDVTEEIDRLSLHFEEFDKILNSKSDDKGKKLDFYCQEFTREVNTMNSKVKDTDLTRLLVELKSSVEKIRQQVQNIQ